MPLEIVTVPCLSDNYAFLARDKDTGKVALVDVPEAAPILAELDRRGWTLDEIWLTHHHPDHVQGLAEVLAVHKAPVTGAAEDAHRLPGLDRAVSDGDGFTLGATDVRVWDVSGHTVGHVAFITDGAAFTADSLMALGCGRVFEGTKPQMWESLQKLAALPRDTLVYSGHEYTLTNAKFARTIEPDNPDLISRIETVERARAAGRPTVPSELSIEIGTNPFLRAHEARVQENLGMLGADPADVFAEIRSRKDSF